jgi:ADP-ribosyl-[dinitrogen reductase] hydrolase
MNKIDKFKGCMIGLACGDYLGAPVEFTFSRADVESFFAGNQLKPVDFLDDGNRRHVAGYYTDDTCMAMCLAQSLIEKGFDTKDQFIRYKQWLFEGLNTHYGDKSIGVGNHTFGVLAKVNENNLPSELDHHERHGGNGALMKCAPIGLLYYQNFTELKDYTIKSTIITHNSRDAVWSCMVQNSFIAYALLDQDKSEFVRLFLADFPDCPVNIKELVTLPYTEMPGRVKLENSGYTLHSLKISLYSFFRSNNFEEAVTESVFMAGDADTQGAIVGALAGAYYGYENIPVDWRKALLNREYIEELAVSLHDKAATNK